MLYYHRSLPIPDFWRAMILARLGRAEGAAKAYGDGIQKQRAGVTVPFWVWGIYYSKALQQEAREVLRTQGIAGPDTETTPRTHHPRKPCLPWRWPSRRRSGAQPSAQGHATVSSAFRSADLGSVRAAIRWSSVASIPPRRIARPSR